MSTNSENPERPRRPRKERSDKGKPRGPRTPSNKPPKSRGSYSDLLRRAAEAEAEKMRLLEQAMAAKADSILASDANFKKLAKAERILRHQLHQDRLNKPRSMQKVERLQRDLHEALAKAKECEDRIPMNEEKLADTLASKEAMRKACIAKLIQTEMAQLDGETSSA